MKGDKSQAMMLGILVTLVLSSSPDAGSVEARTSVKNMLNEFFRAEMAGRKEERLRAITSFKATAATAPRAERPLIERMIRVLEKDEPFQKLVPQFVEIVRDLAKLTRGRFEDERAVAGVFLALPSLAKNSGLDAEPVRLEATTFIRDLVARYPREGAAHGLLASALMEGNADQKLVLAELKQCSALGGSAWCAELHARMLAESERPRCTGSSLEKPLTATGAQEEAAGQLAFNGKKYSPEVRAFLQSEDFSSVSVDAEGNLNLEVTASARVRLEEATRRLLKTGSGAVLLRFGHEILLAARVLEPITEGRIRVTRGNAKPPFKLEDLCRTRP